MSQPRSTHSVPADPDIDDVVAAARTDRPDDMRAALTRAVSTRGIGRCIDEVLLPAARALGVRRSTMRNDERTVRLAVEAMRGWLEILVAKAPTPDAGPPIILACAPGDPHSLPLEAFAVLLRYRRRPCRMLGPRVSSHTMSIALEVNRPVAVIIAAQLPSGHARARELLQAMDEIGITTFYAGAAFDLPLMRYDTPGTYLGTNLESACEVVLDTLRMKVSDGTAQGE